MSINSLFSNHLTILGNSGSGKSYGTTRLLQSVYQTPNFYPYKASMIIFDNNGEYIKAFSTLNQVNPNYNFKVITTSNYNNFEKLHIPVWLLTIDDLALLLRLEKVSQLTLLERMIKLAKIFSLTDDISYRYKNHIIAKAMLSIFYSNKMPILKEMISLESLILVQLMNLIWKQWFKEQDTGENLENALMLIETETLQKVF